MDSKLIGFVPILNGGIEEQPEYEFDCGVHLCATIPPGRLQKAIDITKKNDWVSRNEATHLDSARGCLWAESAFKMTGGESVIKEIAGLSRLIRNILWCIYLQPYGENTYWRNGRLISCCGIYYAARPGGLFNSPVRFPFMYGVPNGEQGTLRAWSLSLLRDADHLASGVLGYAKKIPRVYLAGSLHRLMASVRVLSHSPARLQLAVSALETLFVSPAEHKDLWDPPIPDRLSQATRHSLKISDGYYDRLRSVRNDAVHRGGQRKRGDKRDVKSAGVLIETELILRESLKWAIRNLQKAGEYFEKDSWPTDI